uniref:Phosphatidic acid phosphatase type 2/haloperoxidase domain-containing protein n=1 Tax=viral metagenome TaxID=1070528 RepID=A0A6C0CGY4_9ZZZZ
MATYLILTNKLRDSTIVIIVIALLLPLFMKYYSKEHSLKQLFIGGLIGLLFGYYLPAFIKI